MVITLVSCNCPSGQISDFLPFKGSPGYVASPAVLKPCLTNC